MLRMNMDGNWYGESFRLTVRLSRVELKAPDNLCAAGTGLARISELRG